MTQESEKKPARRVDDKLPGTSVDWSDAPRFNALGIAETWSVTVEAEGQQILCISHEHVAGLDAGLDQFKETIRSCAMHLLGFIGAAPVSATAAPAVSPSPAAAGIEGLTNERIIAIADETRTAESRDGDYILPISFARAIEREVLGAHAGVVAAEKNDAQATLDKICDLFSIGALARSESTILANVLNVLRREKCLAAVEREFFMADVPPDEEDDAESGQTQECMLNWGDAPARYVERFREALHVVAAPAAQAPVQNAEEVREKALDEAVQFLTMQEGWTDDERKVIWVCVKLLSILKNIPGISEATTASKEAAAAEAPSDTALLDSMDAWVEQNKRAGRHHFVFAFDTDSSAREQIAADDILRDALKAQQSAPRENGGE